MKRFLVFMYKGFYPNGGANDCIGIVDTKEEFLDLVEKRFLNDFNINDVYINIIDIKTGTAINSNTKDLIDDSFDSFDKWGLDIVTRDKISNKIKLDYEELNKFADSIFSEVSV